MATKTTNYELTKPDQTDTYNIADFNTDMDTIDAELKKAIDTNIMSGATASQDGTQGLTPAPVRGQQNYVLAGSGAFKNLLSLLTSFTGATSTTAGTMGGVPAPAKGEQNKILTGAGTWQLISALLSAFTGATASAAGTMGAVPAPTAGQQSDLLTGAGTFQSLSSILAPLSLQNGAIYSCDFSNAPTSWWAKFGGSGGLIIQGGTGGGSSQGLYSIKFPISFPNQFFYGGGVSFNGSTQSNRMSGNISNQSKTGMNIIFDPNGNWYAVGN